MLQHGRDLRERAVNALGRSGRGDYSLIEPYWEMLFRFASDEEPKVRLSFIWASENIATNTPDIYAEQLRQISETDENRVVRIHCLGAIRATKVKNQNYHRGFILREVFMRGV